MALTKLFAKVGLSRILPTPKKGQIDGKAASFTKAF
jgi:hypothetical protein